MNRRTLYSQTSGALAVAALFLTLCGGAHDTHAQKRAGAKARKAATQKAAEPKAAAVGEYSCPMHASVVSKTPGNCPKCGMTLRLVEPEEGAHDAHAGDHPAGGAAGMAIPDLELLDQDGRKVNFYSDLVKGKVVAINFIFTTCTTICPPLGATFARVQRDLGERTGRDVHFISVSVDPVTDTPERLKAWGEKFKAGAGWTFVTGDKPQVDALLRALAASSARREDHSPTVLVGNDATGQWTRAYGLAKPSQLVQLINDAAAGKLNAPTATTSSKE
ncbi:MAG TPA: SCO family protein [Pyrinomonadaceae bacterium]|nr:SCO family protein [Pyrinomonadaceae bacterium]